MGLSEYFEDWKEDLDANIDWLKIEIWENVLEY